MNIFSFWKMYASNDESDFCAQIGIQFGVYSWKRRNRHEHISPSHLEFRIISRRCEANMVRCMGAAANSDRLKRRTSIFIAAKSISLRWVVAKCGGLRVIYLSMQWLILSNFISIFFVCCFPRRRSLHRSWCRARTPHWHAFADPGGHPHMLRWVHTRNVHGQSFWPLEFMFHFVDKNFLFFAFFVFGPSCARMTSCARLSCMEPACYAKLKTFHFGRHPKHSICIEFVEPVAGAKRDCRLLCAWALGRKTSH